jgi:hypothetical protein
MLKMQRARVANTMDGSEFVAIDRDKLLFGAHTSLLEIVANCQCIEPNIKAVLENDPAGATLIVLSKTKLSRLGEVKKQQMLDLIEKAGAIRADVKLYSDDISLEERIQRDVYKSRFEVKHAA